MFHNTKPRDNQLQAVKYLKFFPTRTVNSAIKYPKITFWVLFEPISYGIFQVVISKKNLEIKTSHARVKVEMHLYD